MAKAASARAATAAPVAAAAAAAAAKPVKAAAAAAAAAGAGEDSKEKRKASSLFDQLYALSPGSPDRPPMPTQTQPPHKKRSGAGGGVFRPGTDAEMKEALAAIENAGMSSEQRVTALARVVLEKHGVCDKMVGAPYPVTNPQLAQSQLVNPTRAQLISVMHLIQDPKIHYAWIVNAEDKRGYSTVLVRYYTEEENRTARNRVTYNKAYGLASRSDDAALAHADETDVDKRELDGRVNRLPEPEEDLGLGLISVFIKQILYSFGAPEQHSPVVPFIFNGTSGATSPPSGAVRDMSAWSFGTHRTYLPHTKFWVASPVATVPNVPLTGVHTGVSFASGVAVPYAVNEQVLIKQLRDALREKVDEVQDARRWRGKLVSSGVIVEPDATSS